MDSFAYCLDSFVLFVILVFSFVNSIILMSDSVAAQRKSTGDEDFAALPLLNKCYHGTTTCTISPPPISYLHPNDHISSVTTLVAAVQSRFRRSTTIPSVDRDIGGTTAVLPVSMGAITVRLRSVPIAIHVFLMFAGILRSVSMIFQYH